MKEGKEAVHLRVDRLFQFSRTALPGPARRNSYLILGRNYSSFVTVPTLSIGPWP